MGQMTLGGDAVRAQEAYDGSTCQYVDDDVRTRANDPTAYTNTVPQYIDSTTGKCTKDAAVEVLDGTRWIRACKRHARDEWLLEAGLE